jgi:outer membrane lipoprotein SlyB
MRNFLLGLAAASLAIPATMAVPLSGASARDHDHYHNREYHSREWRGRDGRTYCRRSNGTTGLIVGGVGGALVGRAIDTHGDRTTGTILGAAAGALIGKSVDSKRRCE